MKALVDHGRGRNVWEAVSDPRIEAPADAIVLIATTTICGTDLHCGHGAVETQEGRRRRGRLG
jgi:alcohol dehydrogenase